MRRVRVGVRWSGIGCGVWDQWAYFDPLLWWTLFSCYQQIRNVNSGNLSPEELKERQARSMQDPEIQTILTDPVMRQVQWGRAGECDVHSEGSHQNQYGLGACSWVQVLQDFQENPKAAEQHQKNPMIMARLQKLINAGIVQVR